MMPPRFCYSGSASSEDDDYIHEQGSFDEFHRILLLFSITRLANRFAPLIGHEIMAAPGLNHLTSTLIPLFLLGLME